MSQKWLLSYPGVTLLATLLVGVEVRVAEAVDGVMVVGVPVGSDVCSRCHALEILSEGVVGCLTLLFARMPSEIATMLIASWAGTHKT